jgi:hypothetical protein
MQTQNPQKIIQACKLRRECADDICEELHRNFAEIAPRALNILSDLAENADCESVRLGATRDLLDRAGFRPVDRHEIVKHKSIEELNAQLVSLVGEYGAQLLVGAFRSRRSIAGPELAKCISIISKHCTKYNINRFVLQ